MFAVRAGRRLDRSSVNKDSAVESNGNIKEVVRSPFDVRSKHLHSERRTTALEINRVFLLAELDYNPVD